MSEYVCQFTGSGRTYYFEIVDYRGVGWGKVILKRIEPVDDDRVGKLYTFRFENIKHTFVEHKTRKAISVCFVLGEERSKVRVTAWEPLT
jgi:hypothetical protein